MIHIPANSNGTVSTFCVYHMHADQGHTLALGFHEAACPVPVETRRIRLTPPVCDFWRDFSQIQGQKRETQIAGVIID